MQRIACLEVGQYECGQGEGDVGRLISQANIRFAYLDSHSAGVMFTGNSVAARFTYIPQSKLCNV